MHVTTLPEHQAFLALLPKNLILLAHAGELLGNILMQTLEQICLLVLGSPPTQRRFRDAEIICNPLNPAPAGPRQPHGPAFELVKRLCLFRLMATSSILPRGWLSTFAGQVHKFNARVLLTNRTDDAFANGSLHRCLVPTC
jgi:hypothetical protein